jgi:hypothetical protein
MDFARDTSGARLEVADTCRGASGTSECARTFDELKECSSSAANSRYSSGWSRCTARPLRRAGRSQLWQASRHVRREYARPTEERLTEQAVSRSSLELKVAAAVSIGGRGRHRLRLEADG